MNILMATDGSKDATTALRTASRFLRQDDYQVDVLCVAPGFYLAKDQAKRGKEKISRIREEYRRQITRETERILKQAQETLRTEGIEARALMEIGSPASAIVRLAESYDVAVVGAHDRYERTKPGLGPVASRVVQYAPNAVLVARELTAEKSWRVLLALDGSLASRFALRVMVLCFNLNVAEITLFHVVETPWIHLGLEHDWFWPADDAVDQSDPEAQFARELRWEAHGVMEDARAWLDRHGLNATIMVEEGDPALEILSEAEKGDYDLIVLGATGAADLKHDMLGSVSTRVAQHAPCSVFVAKFTK